MYLRHAYTDSGITKLADKKAGKASWKNPEGSYTRTLQIVVALRVSFTRGLGSNAQPKLRAYRPTR